MELEKLSVRLRPRAGWEAVDLGIEMIREWRRPVLLPWLSLAAPCALGLIAALGGWGLVLFWWFLPLFETVVLDPLSRVVFGDPPQPRATLRRAPSLWRRSWRELFLRRLHPARAFSFPIGLLERLVGKSHRQRRRDLGAGFDVSTAIVPVFFLLEACLVVAGFVFVALVIPSGVGPDWSEVWPAFFDGRLPFWGQRLVWSGVALVLLAIHPYYLAAGFALYLDRRTALEGWDLEIAFRRLALRLDPPEESPSRRRSVVPIVLLVLGWSLVAGSTMLRAEEDATQKPSVASTPWTGRDADDPRLHAREILDRAEFGGPTTRSTWQLRKDLREWLETRETEDGPSSEPGLLLGFLEILAAVGELVVWILGGLALLALLALAWRRWPRQTGRGETSGVNPPATVVGLDVRPESLPDDVAGAARRLWQRDERVAALALLYRATLAHLVAQDLPLRGSFTEEDCLLAVRDHLGEDRRRFLTDLTHAWQEAAYAHREPPTDRWTMEWDEHFGDGA